MFRSIMFHSSKALVGMAAVAAVLYLGTAPASAAVSPANNLFIDFNHNTTFDPAVLGNFITESSGAITGADLPGAQLRTGMREILSEFAYYSEYGGDNRYGGNAGQPYHLENDPSGSVFNDGPYPVNNTAVGANGIELNTYSVGTTTPGSRNSTAAGLPAAPGTDTSDLSGTPDFYTARGAFHNNTGLTPLGDDYIYLSTPGTTFPSGTGPSFKEVTVKIGGLSGGSGALVNGVTHDTDADAFGPYPPGTAQGAYTGLAPNSDYRVYLWGYVATDFNSFGGSQPQLDNTGDFSTFGFYTDPTDPTSGIDGQGLKTTSLASKFVTFDFTTGATVSDDLFLQWGIPAGQWRRNAAWNGAAFIQLSENAPPVPEPSTFVLCLIGLVGVGFAAARRRRLRA